MKRSKLVALLAALAVMMTAAVAPATAQEDNSTDTPTTPTETPTPTPDDSDDDESNETTTSTSTSTEDDDDGVVRVQASGDSGGSDFIIDLGNNDEIDTSSVMYTMGPEVTIHDAEYHPDREEMHIDITVNRPNGATLSYIDLSGAKASEEDVGGRIPTIDAPEGTHRLKIPAGSYDGKSRVSLSGLGYYHTVTATAPSDSFLDDLVPYKYAIGGIVLFLAGIVVHVAYKFYREQDTGEPESMDGTTVTSGTVGLKSEVNTDE